ncbi:hypothetical protein GCM10017668_54950 [Streptomyces tuirus]|uniref:Uncharacterized protein n=1 Tax=Streptomyces tuirus TaxID=68278 RepID=A0A7G1NMP0_9ACTN|nr:hypothetical protein GCM10017668_54950 [Streptomyces tuirus]
MFRRTPGRIRKLLRNVSGMPVSPSYGVDVVRGYPVRIPGKEAHMTARWTPGHDHPALVY